MIEIPASLWQRAGMVEALDGRDMGRVFRLVRQYAGASQTRLAIACGMTQGKISGIMRGIQRVSALDVFERIADGLNMPDDARIALGLAPHCITSPVRSSPAQPLLPVIPPRDGPAAAVISPPPGALSVDSPGGDEDEDPVRRRTFVTLTGASLFCAVLAGAGPGGPADSVESFAAVLAGNTPNAGAGGPSALPDLPALAAAVTKAKGAYQACRYAGMINDLPALLTGARGVCATATGDARLRAHTLSAEAHHVAASILLKLGDQGLALLAADRSMQAAQASHDPLTVGSSARIVAHALMSSGHHGAAATTASSQAACLDRDVPAHDRESLSVYGSLLLRGAIAAAQRGDRQTAHELLAEAADAGARLGTDANLRWTAFGPVNVKLHHVHVAVTLGDAGTAIDTARSISLGQVTVTERKASLLIDTARAFLQYGKHENSYLTLRAARDVAPEEITRRPAVRQLVCDLITTAPPSVQRQARLRLLAGGLPMTQLGRVLTVIVCGAGPASQAGTLVQLAQLRGWRVQVIATPAGLGFVDAADLEALTGSAVRSAYRSPGEPRSLKADAVIVAPATYNTISKCALGISDTYALGILAEAVSLPIPVVILPFVNSALADRSPFRRSVEWLRDEGVRILLGPGEFEPHPPDTGDQHVGEFPWQLALDEAGRLARVK